MPHDPVAEPLVGKSAAPSAGAPAPSGYHPEAVEAKWQARWAERGTNEPDLDLIE